MIAFVQKTATGPTGVWSNDREQYLKNVSTNTMDEAKTLLEELGIPLEVKK